MARLIPLGLVAPFDGWMIALPPCEGRTQLLKLDLESIAELDVELTDAPGLPMEEVEEEEEGEVFELEEAEFDGFIERLEIEGNDGTGRMSCGGLQKVLFLRFLSCFP